MTLQELDMLLVCFTFAMIIGFLLLIGMALLLEKWLARREMRKLREACAPAPTTFIKDGHKHGWSSRGELVRYND